jgi:uncharacterized protein
MNTILAFVRRNPILTFACLAYLFSWWVAPFMGGSILSWGLILSAGIVVTITEGRPGLTNWAKGMTHWQVAGYWYVIGPAIIAFYTTSAWALSLRLGATPIHLPQFPDLGTVLTLFLFGGQWEELGWTAYALPALQKRFADRSHGALLAALTVALIRAIWHLPLVLSGHVAWFDMVFLSIAFQLIIAWLFNRTGGSVLVVMVMHFTSNLFGSAGSASFAGQEYMGYYALFVAIALLIALGILWGSGLKLGLGETSGKRAAAREKAA